MVRRAFARAVSARASLPVLASLLALLLGVALAGCAASGDRSGADGGSGTPSPSAGGPPPAPVIAWENHDAHPLEQPRAVAGLAVGLESDRRSASGAALVARSPRTGRVRWSIPVSAALTPDGYGLGWSVVGTAAARRVALLRPHPDPDRSDRADLVLVRPSDGRASLVRGATLFTSFPASCGHGRRVCVDAYPSVGPGRVRRASAPIGAARPRLRSDPDLAAGTRDAVGAGVSLVHVGDVGGEELERVVDGRVRWSRPVTAIFGPNAFAGYGYGFDRAGAVLWGSLLTRPVPRDGELQRDLARLPTAAFDPRTGRTRWRRFGVSTSCSPAEVPLRTPGEASEPGQHAVWCRASGVVHYRADGDGDARVVRATGVHLRVEGFDPATGRTDGWSIDVRTADRIASGDLDLPRAGVASVLLATTRGDRVVDLRTGASRRPGRHETYLCSRARTLGSWPAARHRVVGEVWRACDARGRRLPVIDPGLVPTVAAPIHGTYVLATVGGLIAFRAPGAER